MVLKAFGEATRKHASFILFMAPVVLFAFASLYTDNAGLKRRLEDERRWNTSRHETSGDDRRALHQELEEVKRRITVLEGKAGRP